MMLAWARLLTMAEVDAVVVVVDEMIVAPLSQSLKVRLVSHSLSQQIILVGESDYTNHAQNDRVSYPGVDSLSLLYVYHIIDNICYNPESQQVLYTVVRLHSACHRVSNSLENNIPYAS